MVLPQVLDGLTAHGATWIAAFDRSVDFVRKTNDAQYRASLVEKIVELESKHNPPITKLWTTADSEFQVCHTRGLQQVAL